MEGFFFGVTVFFELSAFLLTYRMLVQYESFATQPMKCLQATIKFFVMRFFRIYVTFVIFCAIDVVLEGVLFGDAARVGPRLAMAAVFIKLPLFDKDSRHGHLWTIHVEVCRFDYLNT